MNNKTILIFLIIALSAIISYFVRKIALDKISRQLYEAAYVNKDTALFESLINSLQAQMFIAERSRKIMSLNYYISINDNEKVKDICKTMKSKNLNTNEFMAFYGSTIGYLCDQGDPYAKDLLNEMKKRYASTKNINELMLLNDCQLTYDVYIDKNTDKIVDIEEILNNELSDEQRAVYEYRLAKLYYYKNDKTKTRELLKNAGNHTENKAPRSKIDSILNGNWSLL